MVRSDEGHQRPMTGAWRRFQGLPVWAQAIGWFLLWPLLVGLLLWRSGRGGTLGRGAAAAIAVLLGPLWLSLVVAGLAGQEGQDSAQAPDEMATAGATPSPQAAPPAAAPAPSPRAAPASPRTPLPSPAPAARPSPQPSLSPSPSPTAAGGATVVRVIDGDTIEATVEGTSERVRLAQVDAPESTSTTECYGQEATARLRELLPAGTGVVLRRPGPPFRDSFGRLLAEVMVDGVSANELLVREGYAEWAEEFATEDPDLARRLEAAEDEARGAGRGLWSACAAPPPPTSGEEQTQPVPFGGSSCHPGYDPCVPPPSEVGDLDCPDIRQEYPNGVQVDHAHGDPHRLDRDRDGHGCE